MAGEENKDEEIVIRLRLISKGNDKPLDGDEYKVRLYDKDVFNDDYLGESRVVDGRAFFMMTAAAFKQPLGMDQQPDFYFVVFKGEEQIFKSRVLQNVDVGSMEEFVMKQGQVVELGTFLID